VETHLDGSEIVGDDNTRKLWNERDFSIEISVSQEALKDDQRENQTSQTLKGTSSKFHVNEKIIPHVAHPI